jgi:hypothetical protein
MSPRISVKADTIHLLGVAAIWKSPQLLFLVLMTVFSVWFINFVLDNQTKFTAKQTQFIELVTQCKKEAYEKYGYDAQGVPRGCRAWANARVGLYENI